MGDLRLEVVNAIKKEHPEQTEEVRKMLELVNKEFAIIEGMDSVNIKKMNEVLPNIIYAFTLEALLIDYVPEEGNEHIYESKEFDKITEVESEDTFRELLKEFNEEETIKYLEKMLSNKNLSGFIEIELETILKNIGIKKFLEVILENNGEHIVEDIFKQTQYIRD